MPLTKEEVDQIVEELLEDCHFLKLIIEKLIGWVNLLVEAGGVK